MHTDVVSAVSRPQGWWRKPPYPTPESAGQTRSSGRSAKLRGMAGLTKSHDDVAKSFLGLMVMATSFKADNTGGLAQPDREPTWFPKPTPEDSQRPLL